MYQDLGNNIIALTVNDWKAAGLTYEMFRNDSKRGFLSIVKQCWGGNTLIDARSIRKADRRAAIEAHMGKIAPQTVSKPNIFRAELDIEARTYFLKQLKPDGSPISKDRLKEYVNRATLLNAIRNGMQEQVQARARLGKRINKGDFWKEALRWYREQSEGILANGSRTEAPYPCQVYKNTRSLERVFKSYLNDSYSALLDGRDGNDNRRKVSISIQNLLLALYRTEDKPFISRVHELYNEFISGNREFYDKKTGEIFRPDDFRHKHRDLELSESTIWNYLKDVVNFTSIYADRNGNFDYMNNKRPSHNRKRGQYSLSKITMDDVALSRKSIRGFVFKYIAVDTVSGYYFRPAYIIGKPNHGTVMEAFRNMFCELTELGLPMPGELEVEHHLMKDLDWLNEAFPFVRFCVSPREKRAEHNIRSLKYGTAKDEGHTRGRWYARHEAYRSVRNKVSGDYIDPVYQPQTIVMDDLADIEKYNNELHPMQKTFPGMTRRQVLMRRINPDLQPIEHWSLYKHIGNETQTTIYNNDYVLCANEKFELTSFESLKRLKPNKYNVTAYWLPEEDGSIKKVYLYQDDVYIGECLNKSLFAYNECAIERTDADTENMLHQNKRLSRFDKMMREERAEIPKIGSMSTETSQAVDSVINRPIPENVTDTIITPDDDEESGDYKFSDIDWSKRGIMSL